PEDFGAHSSARAVLLREHQRTPRPARGEFLTISPLEDRRMTEPIYNPTRSGLLFVDPYNDFLSEGGKLWPRVKGVGEQVGLIENLKAVVKTVRREGHSGVHRAASPLGARRLPALEACQPLPGRLGQEPALRQGQLGRRMAPGVRAARGRRHRQGALGA